MNVRTIIELCLVILCAIGFGVLIYQKVRGNVLAAVGELIAAAEKTGKTGAEKMAWVVECLASIVPAPLKPFLTADRLEKIAQGVFDWMKKYADEYANKLEASNDTLTAEDEKAFNHAMATELISELVNLSLTALKDKATEYGIEVDSMTTRKAVTAAIVDAILNKA